MADQPNLQSLLSRVEGAKTGDRELDARIHCAILGYTDPSWEGRAFCDTWAFGYTYTLNGKRYDSTEAEQTRITTSLDAALALVERAKPNEADVFMRETLDRTYTSGRCEPGFGPRLALALIAALLRALITQDPDNG